MKTFHSKIQELSVQEFLRFLEKMWLPWQRLVLPKLSDLYAQLHINIIHPCKYEEISLNNKGGVIYPHKNLLTDRRTDDTHTIIRPFGRIKTYLMVQAFVDAKEKDAFI